MTLGIFGGLLSITVDMLELYEHKPDMPHVKTPLIPRVHPTTNNRIA